MGASETDGCSPAPPTITEVKRSGKRPSRSPACETWRAAPRRFVGDWRASPWQSSLPPLILTDYRDFAAAQSWLEEALPMAREIADLPLTAIFLKNLGRVMTYRADYRRAVGLLEERPGDC
jgi:hypothetical protein